MLFFPKNCYETDHLLHETLIRQLVGQRMVQFVCTHAHTHARTHTHTTSVHNKNDGCEMLEAAVMWTFAHLDPLCSSQ